MKRRSGFTLVELIIAVFIFGYIAASMSTIYSTSHSYMFQNYRNNIIKTGVLLSMRAVQNNLVSATRVDAPAAGGVGSVLAFAVNVDKTTSCYPVNSLAPVSWHYFCLADDASTPGFKSLYYHTGQLPAGTPCGNVSPSIWNGAYPVPTCGAALAGQTVTKLMQYADTSAGYLFSRRASEGINDSGSVRVVLRSRWIAASRGMGSAQRNVDFTMDTVIRANCPN